MKNCGMKNYGGSMKTRSLQRCVSASLSTCSMAMLVLVFGANTFIYGQSITGALVGTVTDQQGAVVPSASVTATSQDTGSARTVTANALGEYRIDRLAVGAYTLEVNAKNFKRFLQKGVVLRVDETQRLDAQLVVGETQETVTVSSAPPLVDTSTAVLGRTVSPDEIVGLPLVNRNAYAELSLTAGVQSNSASAQSNPSGTPNFQIGEPAIDVIINGGIDGGVPMVSYYLDGGINMTGLRNYGNALPNPDALEEFRVETSAFAAQYGRMSGAVVTAVTKSGTNKFHGSLFEFNRNTDLNAYPWNAPKNPVTGAYINAPYHRNQFGGTVGGPVKHDKAFFFFSAAALRQVVGQLLSGGVVPTALEREGDFTQDTNPVTKVYMPGTKAQVQGTNSSPNCGTPTLNCIPSSLLDPTAANLMTKYVPLPNSGTNGYLGYFTGPTNEDEYLGKYDESIGSKDHAAASYFYVNTVQNAFGGGSIPYGTTQSYSKQQVLNMSDAHTFSSTLANQTWFTLTHVAGGRVNLPTGVDLGSLGSTFTTQGPKALPFISISGGFSTSNGLAGPVSDTNFVSLRDVASATKGKHSLDLGGEISLEKDPIAGNLENFGAFSFATSAPTTTGYALADFVTGQVASMEQDTPYHSLTSDWYFAFFLQDTYRILPRLTLNLGLRYDVQTSPVERQNLTATFVPGVQSTVVASAPLGMLFPGDAGVPRGIAPNQWHHVSPRVGIAWDPFGDGKTAVRAGAGVFFGSVSANEWNQPANAQPFAVRQTFNSITSFSNVYGNPASFPNGNPFPYIYNPSSPRFLPAATVETIAEGYKWPLSYQINAAVQHQFPQHLSATFAYVGVLTNHIPFATDKNYAPYAPGATTSQTSINARRPYDPGVLGQVTYIETQETASYHSLQITASRPLTRNLMLNGFYVLSHSFDGVNPGGDGQSSAQDFANLWEERGVATQDQRHVASISGIWKPDYYQGSNLLLKNIVNGWSISPIVSLQSGLPFTVSTGADQNDDSSNADRPDIVAGAPIVLNPHRCRICTGGAASEWFNTAAFVYNGSGVAGGIGPGGADGNAPRNFLRAPGYRDIDLGVFRDIHFEKLTLQLRGEATNAFNLVSLNAPGSSGPPKTLGAANASSTFGKITGAASPRLIQVGARLTF